VTYPEQVRGLAVCIAIASVCALAAPAGAEQPVQFTLGRVIHTYPDAHGRIGIRSSCAEPGGCKVDYTILRGTASLGGTQALLLTGTVQTDYITLAKSTVSSLRKRRMQVTITADVSNVAGAKLTQAKTVTLGPKPKPKKRRRR
jgi:hypothetical protein